MLQLNLFVSRPLSFNVPPCMLFSYVAMGNWNSRKTGTGAGTESGNGNRLTHSCEPRDLYG